MSVAAAVATDAENRRSLTAKLRRAGRRRKLKAYALIAPVFLFLVAVFVIPILSVLYFSVNNPEVGRILPRVAEALESWDGQALPDEKAFEALAADVKESYAAKTLPFVASRLNYEQTGFRSLLMRTGRKAKSLTEPPYTDPIIAIDERWSELIYWRTIKGASPRFTAHYILTALDLDLQWDWSIERAVPERQVYIANLGRTFWISFVVMLWCVAIGYPIAFLIANARAGPARLMIILVLLPFWTSLLVRTAAWLILLQKGGIVNDTLIWLGITDEPIQLIFNRIGVYFAMVHILLPFMILPLYAVMKSIPHDHMRAAASLGARPLASFLSIYLPQSSPGLAAGCMLVFVIALGFYITPALIGGGSDQMLSYFIAEYGVDTANWGLAGALSLLLLSCVVVVYPVYSRFAGAGGIRLG